MPVPQGSDPRPIDEVAQDELLGLISDGFSTAVRDIWDFSTDLPGFVAREGPESPPAAAIKPVLRLACRRYARGGGPQNLPGFDAAWGSICEPYLESIGENPIPGSVGAPFDGGQCPGVLYRIDYTFNDFGGTPTPAVTFLRGPLSYSRALDPGDSSGSCPPGSTFKRFKVVGFNGETRNLASGCGATVTGISVSPAEGGPNNCGDPAPEYDAPKVRPGLPTLPPSTPIDFPGIGPIGVDVTFDPDGTVNINLPDFGVEVGIEDPFGLGGDGGGGAPPSGPPPGDVGQPGAPVSVGPGGDGEGVAPEGSVLVGLRVQVVTVPNGRARYTDEVLRGAYYVYMGVPGLLDHDPAGAMVRSDQFIFAEQPNLTAWRIRANTGYELVTTPYYRQVEA